MTYKKYIIITILGLAVASSAYAGFWGDFFDRFTPTEENLSASNAGIIDWVYNRNKNLLYGNTNIDVFTIGTTTTSTVNANFEVVGGAYFDRTTTTGNTYLGVTGSTQCLTVDTNGLVTGTGAACSTITTDQVAWEYDALADAMVTTSTKGFMMTASSSIGANLRIDGSATTTGTFYVGASNFVVKESGNVGIGTTAPTSPLTIDKNLATNARYIDVKDNGVTKWYLEKDGDTGYAGEIRLTDNIGFGWGGSFTQTPAQSYVRGSNGNSDLYFGTNALTRMTIKAGNVGIGTTNPQYKLEVQGTASTSQLYLGNGIGTAAGSFLAVDATGLIIATSTPAGTDVTITGEDYASLSGQQITFANIDAANTDLTDAYAWTGANTMSNLTIGYSTSTSKLVVGATQPTTDAIFWVGGDGYITGDLDIAGYASSTTGIWGQGNLHIGGTSSFDGAITVENNRVIGTKEWGGTISSSTMSGAGTTTLAEKIAVDAETIVTGTCFTDTGTTTVAVGDGTNVSYFTCPRLQTDTPANNKFTFTTNNTFTADEYQKVEMGNQLGSPTTMSWNFNRTIDP